MFLGIRAPPVRRADNLAAICEPTVYTMWDPQQASTACFGYSANCETFLCSAYFIVDVSEERIAALQNRRLEPASGEREHQ
jgi:hypothetical protein